MLVLAITLLVISLIWNIILPINKNLWTSSFVFHTAGWSLVLLSIFYLIIDVLQFVKWSFFFIVVGMNSITIYVGSQLIDYNLPVEKIFGGFIQFFDKGFRPVLAICFAILFQWLLFYFLYKKKIFMKV